MSDDTLDLRPVAGGSRLRLRVRPGGRRNAIEGTHAGALKVTVTVPPERGRANRAVEELLARCLALPACAVTIVAGPGSREKVAEITGLSVAVLRDRLSSLLPH